MPMYVCVYCVCVRGGVVVIVRLTRQSPWMNDTKEYRQVCVYVCVCVCVRACMCVCVCV